MALVPGGPYWIDMFIILCHIFIESSLQGTWLLGVSIISNMNRQKMYCDLTAFCVFFSMETNLFIRVDLIFIWMDFILIIIIFQFSRSSVGGSKYLLSPESCPEMNTLKFESRFESGNLAKAIMITPSFYELHLRSDLYTNRHMQWYYFRISNVRKDFLYRWVELRSLNWLVI